ncbi:MAG: C40 family peptidase [Treponema sp.]|nr:C40 family peptidase [Treponema sp.]
MNKAKKILALIAISLVFIGHCAAKTMTTEQAAEARKKIVAQSKQYIGCPYRSGAIGPDAFDCSGLIYTVYHDSAATQMPRSVKAIYSKAKIIKTDEAEIGDLIFFKTTGDGSISHVGIYIGKNQFIHAASDGNNTGVIVSSLKEKYYANSFAAVGRVIPSGRPAKEDVSDSVDDEIVAEEDIPDRDDVLDAVSSNEKPKSKSDNWYSNIVFDATLFCDWNFFLPTRFMLNWRGISLETNARYAAWKFQPGVGTILRYNHASKIFQMPIVFSMNVCDYVKIYAGPVINFGKPTFPDSDSKIKGSFFPGILGVSFQTPKIKAGKVGISFVQDISYTVYNDSDGGAMSFHDSMATGLVFSSGVRVTLPLSNFL